MIEYDNKAWIKLLFAVRGSVMKSILSRIFIFAFLSAIVAAVHFYVHPINIAATPWTIVGVALGLLLVFRTNTSYDRYWEGRKMWGAINNSSRTLGINITSYISPDHISSAHIKEKMVKLVEAFPILVKQRLRLEKNLDEVTDLLDEKELSILDKAVNLPITVLGMLSKQVYKCKTLGLIPDNHLGIFSNVIVELNNSMGACERIRNTPIPIAYALHLKRFLYLFCLTLPFSMVNAFGWWSVLITALVAYAFIGIEEIGVEIEDPFGDDPNDLPLDQICDGIKKTLNDMLVNQDNL